MTDSVNISDNFDITNDDFDDDSSVELCERKMNYNTLKFAVTNARSLCPKLHSMADSFAELGLDFMIVTETWFGSTKLHRKSINDFGDEHGVDLITKNRPTRGGGVCIAYRRSAATFKRVSLPRSPFEVVAAVGNVKGISRKIGVVAVYIPPKYSADEVDKLGEYVTDVVEKLKSNGDPYVCVGGDMNRKDLGAHLGDFPSIVRLPDVPTRGAAALDSCFVDFGEHLSVVETMPPLSSEDSDSDHLVTYYRFNLPRYHHYQKKKKKVRPIKEAGKQAFGRFLAEQNWDFLRGLSASEMVDRFNSSMLGAYDRCLPVKEITVRSCDLPWVSRRIKRILRRKKRLHKRIGRRDRNWKDFAAFAKRETDKNKERFLGKIKDGVLGGGKGSRKYHTAIKLLESTDPSTKKWSPVDLFPGEGDREVAEKAAEFFNVISSEFSPLPPPAPVVSNLEQCPLLYQIAGRLRSMKKPKSQIYGDIDPSIVTEFADLLAIPLQIIFERVFETVEWPKSWKRESVTIIPKNPTPATLGETRNIACTPLFSKLLESFLLDLLRAQTTLTPAQFGGIKGVGVDHFLIETWDEVLQGLEEGKMAVNLMSIDFQKAFNRMDHESCLKQLGKKGASKHLVSLVAAFLSGRTMVVKVGDSESSELCVNGGAPQGSILGPYLFCATSELLVPDPNVVNVRERADPAPDEEDASLNEAEPDLELSAVSSDEDWATGRDFPYFKRCTNPLDDSIRSVRFTTAELDRELGGPDLAPPPPLVKIYIDDFNIIERIPMKNALTHYSQNRPAMKVQAAQSQVFLDGTSEKAEAIKMKVNPGKTQLLCISGDHAAEVSSYISTGELEILSKAELKILGFVFGNRPDVSAQIESLCCKFRRKLWGLRRLNSIGLDKSDCIGFYTTYVRPIIEYTSPTYHSMLNAGQRSRIEKLQCRVMKIVEGLDVPYGEALINAGLESLGSRRAQAFSRFAIKTANDHRFQSRWFPLNEGNGHDLRHGKVYKEYFARTERLRNSPIFAMRRLLNKLEETR